MTTLATLTGTFIFQRFVFVSLYNSFPPATILELVCATLTHAALAHGGGFHVWCCLTEKQTIEFPSYCCPQSLLASDVRRVCVFDSVCSSNL